MNLRKLLSKWEEIVLQSYHYFQIHLIWKDKILFDFADLVVVLTVLIKFWFFLHSYQGSKISILQLYNVWMFIIVVKKICNGIKCWQDKVCIWDYQLFQARINKMLSLLKECYIIQLILECYIIQLILNLCIVIVFSSVKTGLS